MILENPKCTKNLSMYESHIQARKLTDLKELFYTNLLSTTLYTNTRIVLNLAILYKKHPYKPSMPVLVIVMFVVLLHHSQK